MTKTPPVVLTIAGFDPSSGAGVTADIKTIAAHNCYGVAAITALTSQSTAGVRRVEPTDPGLLRETLQELASDVEVAAVHLGMLANAKLVDTVADFLRGHPGCPVVLDPIFRSTSGAELLDSKGREALKAKLLPLAAAITPNTDEAAILCGAPVTNLEEMRAAANRLHELGAQGVVITGGHLEKALDLLSFRGSKGIEQEVFRAEKIKTNSTHGTGCAFSTAIACHLAHQRGLPEAVLLAKAYIMAAISNAHPLGKGKGPVNHLYRMGQARRVGATPAAETDASH